MGEVGSGGGKCSNLLFSFISRQETTFNRTMFLQVIRFFQPKEISTLFLFRKMLKQRTLI